MSLQNQWLILNVSFDNLIILKSHWIFQVLNFEYHKNFRYRYIYSKYLCEFCPSISITVCNEFNIKHFFDFICLQCFPMFSSLWTQINSCQTISKTSAIGRIKEYFLILRLKAKHKTTIHIRIPNFYSFELIFIFLRPNLKVKSYNTSDNAPWS